MIRLTLVTAMLTACTSILLKPPKTQKEELREIHSDGIQSDPYRALYKTGKPSNKVWKTFADRVWALTIGVQKNDKQKHNIFSH